MRLWGKVFVLGSVLLLGSCGLTPTTTQTLEVANAEEVVQAGSSGENAVSAQQVEDVNIENVTQQMPPWMFFAVCLLAGWAIPSPTEMAGGLLKVCGSLGSFILKLLGRN